ncbi:MAG: SLBB domain-containing protein [Gemmatimonadales bacterium]|nr:SLBB domain-containing protein [Gemmatimonadales bacterium]
MSRWVGHTTIFLPLLRSMRILAPVLLAFVAFTASASAQDSRATSEQSVLSPGDSVRIVVWRKPEFTGDFVVAPNGTITHPLFRSVQVAGMPFATAEANLRRFLARFEENPEFVMEPLIRVAVSGEVDRPQVFALRPETTIAEAVARAGGATEQGARNRVRLLRLNPTGAQELLFVNLTDPTDGYGRIPVRSGDQIIVDRSKSFLRDILLPTLGVIGSIASLGLLVDRVSRNN